MKKTEKYDVIVVGAGLAGLSCAYELTQKGKRVLILEAHPYAGGRTSSFVDRDIKVESGLHRYIGYYSALPRLLKKCGVKIGDIVTWEEKVDILVKDKNQKVVLGLAPFWGFRKAMRGITENTESLSWRDKFSLVPFFVCGFCGLLFPDRLDSYSVTELANRHGVSEKSKRLILEPLSTGIFFLPPENYSAYAFFRLFAPAVWKFYKMRIGAFLGGMTEVMCDPIVRMIEARGGTFRFCEPVECVVLDDSGAVTGIRTKHGEEYLAAHTVVATPLPTAKHILSPLAFHPALEKLFALPTMSACSIQLELDRPALNKDITTFGPGTDMVSFAEQSRTTFCKSHGRLSVILGNAKEYAQKSEEEILVEVLDQMDRLGVHLRGHVRDYRKVAEEDEFYALTPGSQKLRPKQRTGIQGVTLAGDYTRTASLATMEGAVLSGRKAAKNVMKDLSAQR